MSRQEETDRHDDARLKELIGAEQTAERTLKRSWGLLQNFGSSFAIISTVTGMTSQFAYGLTTGGPGTMVVGWIVGCTLTFSVAFSMAEIVSYIPSAGGPYHWAWLLSPPRYRACASWITGWFNLLGQIALTTGISFALALFITAVASFNNDWNPTPGATVGIYAAILVIHGTINTFGIVILGYLNNVSILLHSLGVFSLSVAVLAKASPNFQPASFVYSTFVDDTGVDGAEGWSQRASPAYVAIIGLLYVPLSDSAVTTMFTITGYDASAHMSEETHNAARNAPIGVISSVMLSAVFGFFYLNAMLFSIQDVDEVYEAASGNPVYSIFLQLFSQAGATVLFSLVMACVFFCGLFSMASNSRMMYAFARDGALPRVLCKLDKRTQAPIATIWLSAFLAFCLGLPYLGSSVAYTAATSIATIGLYISYSVPIFIGMLTEWPRGPFRLGKASKPIAFIASCYTVFITVAFCLPELNPVNSQTLNLGIVGLWAVGSWVLWAHKWFTGPTEAEALRTETMDSSATIGSPISPVDEEKIKV